MREYEEQDSNTVHGEAVDDQNTVEKYTSNSSRSEEVSRKFAGKTWTKLIGVNLAGAVLSGVNEQFVGHTALGFSQLVMETVDLGMVAAIRLAQAADDRGKHLRAFALRQSTYLTHIAAGCIGAFESFRLVTQDSTPSSLNVGISLSVALANMWAISADDDIESETHQLNKEGYKRIGQTNVVEAAAGVLGPLALAANNQGSTYLALASNVIVIGIMGRQVIRDGLISNKLRKKRQSEA